jgi:ABC-type Fe3+/spermidine/putrescine transport system ATPase subunit
VAIEVRHISRAFSGTPVLTDLSFDLPTGQTLAVLGRSGCGKTTLLKIIAGLLAADSGSIHIGGRNVEHEPPQQRGAVYLYQEPLLFPHLTVFENVAFGLRLRHETASNVRERTSRMLEHLDLSAHAGKKSGELSGGQRQRAAFGRALIINPSVLLLDEPFGNLDVETRAEMQLLFKKIAAEYHITAVFVTHDLKEAVRMGDRLSLLENGRLQVFEHLDAFIRDPRTGMQAEINFWNTLVP